jgi:subtilisin family serine protease
MIMGAVVLVTAFVLPSGTVSADALALRSGVVTEDPNTTTIAPELRSSDDEIRSGGPVVLTIADPRRALRRNLEELGIRLGLSVGPRSFVAWLPAGALDVVRSLPGVTLVAALHPGLRIAPELSVLRADDPRARVRIRVLLFPRFDPAAIARRLAGNGLDVERVAIGSTGTGATVFRPGWVDLRGSPATIVGLRAELARWPEVLWLEELHEFRWTNDAGAWVGQSGLDGNQSTPVFAAGLYGEGQILALVDSGIDADMCFFRDDAQGPPPVQVGLGPGAPDFSRRKLIIVDFLSPADDPSDPDDWDDIGHGTHTSGSAVADDPTTPGRRDPGDGMAPAAKLIMQDLGAQPEEQPLYPILEQAYLQGARIHSNSFSDTNSAPFNLYSVATAEVDAFAWDHRESLVLFSAGNFGPGSGTVSSPSTAKNVVAVGATRHGSSAGKLWQGSSHGPTADGRIKPDLVAPGQSVVSANNDGDVGTNNCGTTGMTGTSMACPTAAGLAALVREYVERGYHPTGAAVPAHGFEPSAALLKAMLIASTRPMENVQQAPPAELQGWGRLLLDDGLHFQGEGRRLWLRDVTDGFSTSGDPDVEFEVEVLDPTEPLRVVLTWTDYPSTPMAVTNLVNDLDLEVEEPAGTVYRGNNFVDGLSVPGGVADRLNNVESVLVDSPAAGLWKFRVRSHAIPQPTQAFALVITAAMPIDLLSPNPVDDLGLDLDGDDITLLWQRPSTDSFHGATERYRVFRSDSASGGFALLGELNDVTDSVSWTDSGGVTAGTLLFYEVIAGNESGDADALPGP